MAASIPPGVLGSQTRLVNVNLGFRGSQEAMTGLVKRRVTPLSSARA